MNLIEEIGEALFNMTHLKVLSLTNNVIRFIADGTFRNNSFLQHLYLSGNKLEWLGKDCFQRLFSLKELVIAENLLMSPQWLDPPPSQLEVSLRSQQQSDSTACDRF
ncbi:hypothetical protein HPB48_023323 [Haemaphysalis longicornis]|uniref:Uncharacterized protein n=1 Tax=Haemaphysalis longicornis TaxID=44386 RepID=A0A9J6H605_HAELO|nr:hypothetical protein HPB48_023323 [Haemaphysalis longicornis]